MSYPIASDSPESKTDVPSDNQDFPDAVPNDTASKHIANPEITHRVHQLRATPAQTVKLLALAPYPKPCLNLDIAGDCARSKPLGEP